MENPKIRIESDGRITKVYIDGKEIKGATNIGFHAVPANVQCIVLRIKMDENERPATVNNDIVKEIAFEL